MKKKRIIRCEECGSGQTYFRRTTEDWCCKDCGHISKKVREDE